MRSGPRCGGGWPHDPARRREGDHSFAGRDAQVVAEEPRPALTEWRSGGACVDEAGEPVVDVDGAGPASGRLAVFFDGFLANVFDKELGVVRAVGEALGKPSCGSELRQKPAAGVSLDLGTFAGSCTEPKSVNSKGAGVCGCSTHGGSVGVRGESSVGCRVHEDPEIQRLSTGIRACSVVFGLLNTPYMKLHNGVDRRVVWRRIRQSGWRFGRGRCKLSGVRRGLAPPTHGTARRMVWKRGDTNDAHTIASPGSGRWTRGLRWQVRRLVGCRHHRW